MTSKEKAELEKAESKSKDKTIDKIAQIIAAINPNLYAKSGTASEIEKLKSQGAFWQAVEKSKLGVAPGESPVGTSFELDYNSSMESLEPIYFWILDFMEQTIGLRTEKVVDNFISSPGSGHFSELMMKGTRMQEESMKIMQTIGILIKGIINIIYDLRQFEQRLKDYKQAKSENKEEARAGLNALKQIWMDNVDIKRGNTSIKAMAFSQASFTTLIDAFMAAENLKQLSSIDLNERVKRIAEQRFQEFENWIDLSGKELDKRYRIQKAWLKSQVDTLKLYSRWAKPYLKAAEELRMGGGLSNSAALVKAFNTILLQLVILGKGEVDVEKEVREKGLPKSILGKKLRKYTPCVLVGFEFRGIPQKVDQHYGFGGKSNVKIYSFALNDEELNELDERLKESDLKEAMNLVENATQTSLKEIQDDIDYFLKEDEEKEKEDKEKAKEEKAKTDVNPFSALLGLNTLFKSEGKKAGRKKGDAIKPDSFYEKLIRAIAQQSAKKSAFLLYDIYKKGHGMAAAPFGDQIEKGDVNVSFKEVFKN